MVIKKSISKEKPQLFLKRNLNDVVCWIAHFTTLKTHHWILQNYQVISFWITYFVTVLLLTQYTTYNIISENGISSLNAKHNFHKYPRHFPINYRDNHDFFCI